MQSKANNKQGQYLPLVNQAVQQKIDQVEQDVKCHRNDNFATLLP